MSYRQVKRWILITPTLTIAVWEYVRHAYLLPYVSMELGNWLSPGIVFVVSVTFLRKLFSMMESIQEELRQERAVKAAMEERERIARELHDGIAQSLFLLSVQVDRLERTGTGAEGERLAAFRSLRGSVRQTNDYVRHAIANLRYPPNTAAMPWMESIERLAADFAAETGLDVALDWNIPASRLSPAEKVELYAVLREAMVNVRKHAEATSVRVSASADRDGWSVRVEDDGRGFEGDPFACRDRFGLRMVRRRAAEAGWTVRLERNEAHTVLTVERRHSR